MVLFNYSTRELTAKIVYYGPGLCGKTTNLQYVYSSLPDSVKKGKMLSLATKTDRTLFFDFLPIELGTIRGMRTRIQLYTVPGQVFYNSTRKLVLKGADGVVFVADSQSKMIEANTESYRNLEENLKEMGIRIEEIPLVMQFNKRDLPNLCSVEEMNTRINRHNAPFYEAVAMTGIGVEDTLKAITKLVLNNLSARYRLEEGQAPRAAGAAPIAEAPGPVPRPAPAREDRRAEETAIAAETAPREKPAIVAPAHETPGRAVPVFEPETPSEDVIELTDEVGPDGASGGLELDGPSALPDAVLPRPVTVHPMPARPAGRPVPAARAATRSDLALETEIDDEDPIDLDEALDETPGPEASAAASRPGAGHREIQVPLTIDLGGRTLQILMTLKVRLSG